MATQRATLYNGHVNLKLQNSLLAFSLSSCWIMTALTCPTTKRETKFLLLCFKNYLCCTNWWLTNILDFPQTFFGILQDLIPWRCFKNDVNTIVYWSFYYHFFVVIFHFSSLSLAHTWELIKYFSWKEGCLLEGRCRGEAHTIFLYWFHCSWSLESYF